MLTTFLIITGAFIFAVALTGMIQLVLKKSEAYHAAFERAAAENSVVNIIGRPVKTGFLVQGGLRGGRQLARMRFLLIGSNGRGTLEFFAERINGVYEFRKLKFHAAEQTIDLLSDN